MCLQAILNPLRWRTTSWLGDEAICLAGLLELTLAERAFLFKLDATQRLKQLVLSLDSVPLDIRIYYSPIFLDRQNRASRGFRRVS